MDTSPLLRQMLEEQGIAREHLERVSDNQPIPGISDHLSDHSHSTATSRYTHSQPHSQTTSSYVGPSVISNGLHQEHGPGMSDHHSDSHSVHSVHSAVSSRH